MGQKSNPNSWKTDLSSVFFSNSFLSKLEYSRLLLDYYWISQSLITYFEKQNCLIKNFYFFINIKKAFITIYISFFPLNLKKRNISSLNNVNISQLEIEQKIFNIFSLYGFNFKKRIVFHNLKCKKQKKEIEKHLNLKLLNKFKKEIYYYSSLELIKIMLTTKNNADILVKYISKFFKIFHRSKKFNKFYFFIAALIKTITNLSFIKGIKIQIKGRFKGAARSSVRILQAGVISLQTFDSNLSYAFKPVMSSYGVFGIKIWINEK